jgi:hypothetical protein
VIVNEFRTAGLTATVAKASSLLGQCEVAKPQTWIAELPFSPINLRRWQPDNATVNDSFLLVGRKAAFHNEHGVLDLGGQMIDRAKSSTVLQAIA